MTVAADVVGADAGEGDSALSAVPPVATAHADNPHATIATVSGSDPRLILDTLS
ncbi:hypothetical protein [Miniimonas arenae]|uniref:hypothetical protein n=1 Tax=Miniimonas arenae TaxID=676201 RepID=UPI0015D58BDB|nr:hypothetical protein [Miniimonas arenae]